VNEVGDAGGAPDDPGPGSLPHRTGSGSQQNYRNAPRIPAGDTRQLTATVVDDDGRAIPGEPMAFESSEPAVVTVSDAGLLTSVGPLGTATITAASGDLNAEIEAEVVHAAIVARREPVLAEAGSR
jgi:hypothetical protein